MDSEKMKRLKVGYAPLSKNLKAAGDRRRLVFWAKARGHEIVTDLDRKVDVLVISEKSNFNSSSLANTRAPIVFDLVDAYLSPSSIPEDFVRGIAKWFTGEIGGAIKPFSYHIRDFCRIADAVVCSSIEQKEVISRLNPRTHVILDSHEEIDFLEIKKPISTRSKDNRILWEGQPATIPGIRQISSALLELQNRIDFELDLVTDERYFKILGNFIQSDTISLIKRNLTKNFESLKIVPWTIDNLVNVAKTSKLGLIPIDISVPMQRLNPENRMLIMWRLGLPCLTSPSPAYIRVASEADVSSVCYDSNSWLSKIITLLENETFAHEEILKGQNYLRENHTEKILLEKWDNVIESVLK